jgi:hypothetical protein
MKKVCCSQKCTIFPSIEEPGKSIISGIGTTLQHRKTYREQQRSVHVIKEIHFDNMLLLVEKEFQSEYFLSSRLPVV